ncbi:MAG: TIGR03619 family F420-dependent LLM class oxidoreductase [Solirubrobacterales bacterium]
MPPRLVVGLTNFGDFLPDGEWGRLVEVATAAEAAGIGAVSLVDHVVLGGDLGDYPYGSFPGGPEDPWLEPLTTLAAFAGATDRIGLMTAILIAPLRPPALLAKAAATLDQISGGRLELGVGTGWQAKEYEAAGLSFADRGRLLDAAIDACRELWRPGPTELSCGCLSLSDVYCSPQPRRPGGVPFWVAGRLHPRNLERVVRRGDGWIPSPSAPAAEVAEGAARLRAACAEAGRDPASLRVRIAVAPRREEGGATEVGSTFRNLPAILESTGATDVFVAHAAFSSRYDGREEELFGRLATDFAAVAGG